MDADYVYGFVGQRLYRYRRAAPKDQHPAVVAEDVVWLAGPYRGALYVQRTDGVHALRPEERVVRDRLVLPTSAYVTAVAAVGGTVYFALSNGRVGAVDARDGRALLDAAACPAARIGTTPQRVLFVCPGTPAGTVLAFARPGRP